MDKNQISLIVDRASGHWNQDFYPESKKSIKRSYNFFLQDIEYADACDAVDLLAHTSKSFPTAYEVKCAVIRSKLPEEELPPTPAEAWRDLSEVRKRAFSGAHKNAEHHQVFKDAYREIGRDVALGLSEFRSDREFFLDVYNKHLGLWFREQSTT